MTDPAKPDQGRLFTELRPAAFAVAYRMLGRVTEAEDVVQEALLRVHQTLDAGESIASPRAFVVTVTTRLAINALHAARARRERYVGAWLPELILTDRRPSPAQEAEATDSLSVAVLVLLESLSPEQRAAWLLHDVFGYGYPEVAAVVGTSEGNARQLTARARRHVAERRPRYRSTREARDELAHRFVAAAKHGDLAGLEALLAPDVALTGDGGGRVPALARMLHGRGRVARTLLTWVRQGLRIAGVSLRPESVNGEPGVLFLDGEGRLISVWSIEVDGGAVTNVRAVVNPDKLGHLGPVAAYPSIRSKPSGQTPTPVRPVR